MKKEKDIFLTNPEKAQSKITINAFMMGSLFFILSLIWSLNPERFGIVIIAQIVLAIPLLFVSSLAYAKIGHQKEAELWDMFGWFTNTTGNAFILNVVGLMTAMLYAELAMAYFVLTAVLMAIYSAINIAHNPNAIKEKAFKFLYFIFIIILGGMAPALL